MNNQNVETRSEDADAAAAADGAALAATDAKGDADAVAALVESACGIETGEA